MAEFHLTGAVCQQMNFLFEFDYNSAVQNDGKNANANASLAESQISSIVDGTDVVSSSEGFSELDNEVNMVTRQLR